MEADNLQHPPFRIVTYRSVWPVLSETLETGSQHAPASLQPSFCASRTMIHMRIVSSCGAARTFSTFGQHQVFDGV